MNARFLRPSLRALVATLALAPSLILVGCKPGKPAAHGASDPSADDTAAAEGAEPADASDGGLEAKRKAAEDAVKAIAKMPATSVEEMQKIVEKHGKAIEKIAAYEKAADDALSTPPPVKPKKAKKEEDAEEGAEGEDAEAEAEAAKPKAAPKNPGKSPHEIATALRKKAEKHLVARALACADALEKKGDPLDALQAVIFVQRRQWRPDFPLEKQDLAPRYTALNAGSIAKAKEVFGKEKSYATLGGFVSTKAIAAGEAEQAVTFSLKPDEKGFARVYFADTLKAVSAGKKKVTFSTTISCYTEAAAKAQAASGGEHAAVTETKPVDTKKFMDKPYVEFPIALAPLVKDGLGLCNVAASGRFDGEDGTIETDGVWVVVMP